MLLLVGLGNPGPRYATQPAQYRLHGGGRDCPPPFLSAVAGALPGRMRRRHDRRDRKVAGPEAADLHERVRPGGRRGGPLLSSSNREQVVVLHDEIDLAPGKVRVKQGGGHRRPQRPAQHRCPYRPRLRRVRIGIGHPGDKDLVHGHVLQRLRQGRRPMAEPHARRHLPTRRCWSRRRRQRLHDPGGLADQPAETEDPAGV